MWSRRAVRGRCGSDFSGDGRADLAGRDSAGDLWLYQGDGAGSYSPRTKIGYSYPAGELLF